MAKTTIPTAVRADREYLDKLLLLSRTVLGKPMSDAIRDAIDEKYGEELASLDATFAALRGKKDNHRKGL